MEYQHTLVVTIDGAKVFQGQLGGGEDMRAIDQQQAPAVAAINGRFQNIPLKISAGPHKVGVTFIARTYAESDDVLFSFRPGVGEERIPRVGSVEIQGPFTAAGVSETPSRRRILVCRPASAAEELPCATRILSSLARRAFRRPLTDQDLDAPLAFYKSARAEGGFDAGSWDSRRAAGDPRQPEIPVSRRAHAGRRCARVGASHHRSRPRVAPFVLPARHSSRRGAASSR
jgi:hypothetical protein